jgi:hypothetical protein
MKTDLPRRDAGGDYSEAEARGAARRAAHALRGAPKHSA